MFSAASRNVTAFPSFLLCAPMFGLKAAAEAVMAEPMLGATHGLPLRPSLHGCHHSPTWIPCRDRTALFAPRLSVARSFEARSLAAQHTRCSGRSGSVSRG